MMLIDDQSTIVWLFLVSSGKMPLPEPTSTKNFVTWVLQHSWHVPLQRLFVMLHILQFRWVCCFHYPLTFPVDTRSYLDGPARNQSIHLLTRINFNSSINK